MSDFKKNIARVISKIEYSASKVGKSLKDINLVAVTKSVDENVISNAISLGITDVGENRVQDFLNKYESIKKNVRWHFIGHLQTNKVKYLVNKVSLIHSLDRDSLAFELNKQGKKHNYIFNCLVQVNISGEETKYGLKPELVAEFVKKHAGLECVRIKGFMTIAPFKKDPEDTRYVFEELRKLKEKLELENIPNVELKYLSMGMSNDYQIAIEEGANMVRIGSEIFQ